MHWQVKTLLIDPDAAQLQLGEPPRWAGTHLAKDGHTILARLHGEGVGAVQTDAGIQLAGRPNARPYLLLVSVYPVGGGPLDPARPAELPDGEPSPELLKWAAKVGPPRYPTFPELVGAVDNVAPRGAVMGLAPVVSFGQDEDPPRDHGLYDGGTVLVALTQVGSATFHKEGIHTMAPGRGPVVLG